MKPVKQLVRVRARQPLSPHLIGTSPAARNPRSAPAPHRSQLVTKRRTQRQHEALPTVEECYGLRLLGRDLGVGASGEKRLQGPQPDGTGIAHDPFRRAGMKKACSHIVVWRNEDDLAHEKSHACIFARRWNGLR